METSAELLEMRTCAHLSPTVSLSFVETRAPATLVSLRHVSYDSSFFFIFSLPPSLCFELLVEIKRTKADVVENESGSTGDVDARSSRSLAASLLPSLSRIDPRGFVLFLFLFSFFSIRRSLSVVSRKKGKWRLPTVKLEERIVILS